MLKYKLCTAREQMRKPDDKTRETDFKKRDWRNKNKQNFTALQDSICSLMKLNLGPMKDSRVKNCEKDQRIDPRTQRATRK